MSWVEYFLSNRTFRVRVGETTSLSDYQVNSGIPQGAVVGPIIFLLNTSDLPSSVRLRWALFADDTKIYYYPLRRAVTWKAKESCALG